MKKVIAKAMKKAGPRRKIRGMTLIEIMVASAIAAIILSSATSAIVGVMKSVNETKRKAGLDGEVKLLTEYLVSRLQPVGGGGVRPWSAIAVEDNFSGGTDRLTLFEIDDSVGECPIGTVTGAVINFTPTSPCCMTTVADWENVQVLAVSQNGANTMSLYSNNGVSTPGTTCQLNFPAGFPPDSFGDELDRLPSADMDDFEGGTLVMGKFKRIYLNTTSHELILEDDLNGNNIYEANEQIVLADEIYDFQIALGYDLGTPDGHITDTNSINDEWLHNAPGSAEVLGVSAGLVSGTAIDLRMIAVGITMGVRNTNQNNSVALLNGPPQSQSGRFLRGTIGRATLRNLALFDL